MKGGMSCARKCDFTMSDPVCEEVRVCVRESVGKIVWKRETEREKNRKREKGGVTAVPESVISTCQIKCVKR